MPSAAHVDFNHNHLRVTYDATKKPAAGKNPQVKFWYDADYVGIRLPTESSKTIKWRYTAQGILQNDMTLTKKDTWTFVIASDGRTILTSPTGNSYPRSFSSEVPDFRGGNLEVGFDDFPDDGVSCYEIYNPFPGNTLKLLKQNNFADSKTFLFLFQFLPAVTRALYFNPVDRTLL